MAVCVCVSVWQLTPRTADVIVTKIAGYVCGQFVEYIMIMHAAGCWLDKTVWVSPLYLKGTAGCACNAFMQLGCVGRFDFALMASQLLGVSLKATRDTTKVMLGVSLRAR